MSKIRQYPGVVFLLLWVACRPSPAPAEKVLAIREMGALATTEYTVTKIVKAEDNKTWYKLGDRKILMSIEATIKAGIDLKKIKNEDVQIKGKAIRILLPAPEIILIQLPPDKIKLEYEELGLLRSSFDQAERMQLLEQAEKQVEAALPETGILENTRKHTRDWIQQFCRQLGFEEVTIEFNDQQQAPVLR
ncbi:DUF4230 domain-containing protein [Flavihumibacter sp. CACIAM 22H1]|uniref:DUF4230 domain-containing protein n=1 Tax=Flavihumibacter sp. CACIAM 22H1 TaxID=1812911 RepID=UPI0007A7DEF9|nr:DUF4230 domain-containing protein [Flavihumibacter sp. CACIAM 22H1]KYP12986.1 MAG: hypothetical protein A1D16_03670 [Flavihumibacter sp. CACIAM 22H1]